MQVEGRALAKTLTRGRFLLHCTGLARADQEAVDVVWARDRFRLGAVAFELGPDAGEGEQRPVVIEREPNHVRSFAEMEPVQVRAYAFWI
jgi:hypothetical protein